MLSINQIGFRYPTRDRWLKAGEAVCLLSGQGRRADVRHRMPAMAFVLLRDKSWVWVSVTPIVRISSTILEEGKLYWLGEKGKMLSEDQWISYREGLDADFSGGESCMAWCLVPYGQLEGS